MNIHNNVNIHKMTSPFGVSIIGIPSIPSKVPIMHARSIHNTL